VKHKFEHWSAIRNSGMQRATMSVGDCHSKCSVCGVVAKRKLGTTAFLGQPATKNGPIKYWVGGTWTSNSPVCSTESLR